MALSALPFLTASIASSKESQGTTKRFLKKLVEDDQSLDEIVSEGFDLNDVKKISMLLSRSEYKRFQSAPGPKVTEKAFGRDRRYPLTSGFRNWN